MVTEASGEEAPVNALAISLAMNVNIPVDVFMERSSMEGGVSCNRISYIDFSDVSAKNILRQLLNDGGQRGWRVFY